jgi:zinc protease
VTLLFALLVVALPSWAAKPKRGNVPQLLVVSRPWPKLVSVRLLIGGGALADPPGQEGLTALGWSVALRGAGSRDRQALSQAFDALGVQPGLGVDKLGTTLYADVASENLEKCLELLADVVLHPRFESAQVDNVREEMIADIEHLHDDDAGLAVDAIGRYLYRGTLLGRPTGGTKASLQTLTTASLSAWHSKQIGASNVHIGLSGAIDRPAAEALVHKLLGDFPTGPALKPPPSKADDSGRRLLLIDKPRRAQAQVVLALSTVPANHRDALPLLLVNAVLGGPFTSRLNREIRELRGWSYGAWSSLSGAPNLSTWAMGFAPNARDASAAIDLAVQILEELRKDGISTAELRFAKDYLIGAHRLGLETADRELAERMRATELGLDDDEVDTFEKRIEAIDHKTVQRVLRERLRHDNLVATVVGSAKTLRDKLTASAAAFAVEVLERNGLPEQTAQKGLTPAQRPATAVDAPAAATEDDDGAKGVEEEPDEP